MLHFCSALFYSLNWGIEMEKRDYYRDWLKSPQKKREDVLDMIRLGVVFCAVIVLITAFLWIDA